MIKTRWLVLLSLFLFSACSSAEVKGDDDADGDAGGGDSDSDGDGDRDSDTIVDEVCEEQAFDLSPVLGRLMILLDMSYSMRDPTDNPKWDQAKEAINAMMNKFKGQGIEFGLDVFPDGSLDGGGVARCGTSNPVVLDTALNNEQTVIDELAKLYPNGATPMYCAMKNFMDDTYAPGFTSGDDNKVLIIVADGQDNCGDTCVEYDWGKKSEFEELTKQLKDEKGIKSAAIGFGSDAYADQLDIIAANGGTEFKTMIVADDKAGLEDALGRITGLVVNCVFNIQDTSKLADLDQVNFYFDDKVIGQDVGCEKESGWTWANDQHSAVQFCESACRRLQTGVDEVTVKFGCKTVVM